MDHLIAPVDYNKSIYSSKNLECNRLQSYICKKQNKPN